MRVPFAGDLPSHPVERGESVRETLHALSDGTPTPLAHPGRRRLTLLLAPIIAMVVCGYVADALWPSLVSSNPLLLISLSAKNRYLVLVVNHVDLVAYYVIGTLRLLAPDPFFFAIGWLYGAAALHWMERRTPTVGSYMRTLERWFERFGAPLVVLFPNNYICLIAGVARMSPALFVALDVVGTLGRLLMIQVLGDIFAGPVDSFLSFVSHWRIPILIVTVALVAITTLGEFRRGDRERDALQELEDAADEVAIGHPVDHTLHVADDQNAEPSPGGPVDTAEAPVENGGGSDPAAAD